MKVGIGEEMIQALYSDNVVEQEAATQKFRKLLSRGEIYYVDTNTWKKIPHYHSQVLFKISSSKYLI